MKIFNRNKNRKVNTNNTINNKSINNSKLDTIFDFSYFQNQEKIKYANQLAKKQEKINKLSKKQSNAFQQFPSYHWFDQITEARKAENEYWQITRTNN